MDIHTAVCVSVLWRWACSDSESGGNWPPLAHLSSVTCVPSSVYKQNVQSDEPYSTILLFYNSILVIIKYKIGNLIGWQVSIHLMWQQLNHCILHSSTAYWANPHWSNQSSSVHTHRLTDSEARSQQAGEGLGLSHGQIIKCTRAPSQTFKALSGHFSQVCISADCAWGNYPQFKA